MVKLRVNGELLVGEDNIKEGAANSFQRVLTEAGEWRSSIDELIFYSLLFANLEALEIPFSKEVFTTLSSLGGDKAPSPNGFSLAFWHVVRIL